MLCEYKRFLPATERPVVALEALSDEAILAALVALVPVRRPVNEPAGCTCKRWRPTAYVEQSHRSSAMAESLVEQAVDGRVHHRGQAAQVDRMR